MPLLAAVTCLSEQGGSAAVGDCVRWAGAMPALVQECHIPCKDDCTFTPWSKFTACSSDCDTARSRRRSLTGIIFYNICLIGDNASAVLEWWENPEHPSLVFHLALIIASLIHILVQEKCRKSVKVLDVNQMEQ